MIATIAILIIFFILFYNYKNICDYFGEDYSKGLIWIFLDQIKKLLGLM